MLRPPTQQRLQPTRFAPRRTWQNVASGTHICDLPLRHVPFAPRVGQNLAAFMIGRNAWRGLAFFTSIKGPPQFIFDKNKARARARFHKQTYRIAFVQLTISRGKVLRTPFRSVIRALIVTTETGKPCTTALARGPGRGAGRGARAAVILRAYPRTQRTRSNRSQHRIR